MCDLVGMASADSITAALVLGSDLTNWGFLPDRSVQGMVNSLVRRYIKFLTPVSRSELQLSVVPSWAHHDRFCSHFRNDIG